MVMRTPPRWSPLLSASLSELTFLIRIAQTCIWQLLNLTLFFPSRPLLHSIMARAGDDLYLIVIRIIAFKRRCSYQLSAPRRAPALASIRRSLAFLGRLLRSFFASRFVHNSIILVFWVLLFTYFVLNLTSPFSRHHVVLAIRT